MNENDGHDREVRDYVRNRMAADMPPEFTRDVMNDVQRTPQRRRGGAWPIFTGLATVTAAVAAVVIGLALLNQPDEVGTGSPTPSASASPEATQSPTPEASATKEATPSATAEPTSGDGEFGPIHSMSPADAFANGQTCEVTTAIVNAEVTDFNWAISFPEGWFTNEPSTEHRSSCTLFGPEPFEAPDGQEIPDSVVIYTEIPPGGDFSTDDEIIRTERFTVDGVPALRYEFAASDGGFTPEPHVLWIIGIGGNLPAVGNDQPYLALTTFSNDPDELAAQVDILDRMVATFDLGE